MNLEVEMYWRMASVILQKKYASVSRVMIADALAIFIWETSGILEVSRKRGYWFRVAEGFEAPDFKVEISSELYKEVNARIQKAEAKMAEMKQLRLRNHRPW